MKYKFIVFLIYCSFAHLSAQSIVQRQFYIKHLEQLGRYDLLGNQHKIIAEQSPSDSLKWQYVQWQLASNSLYNDTLNLNFENDSLKQLYQALKYGWEGTKLSNSALPLIAKTRVFAQHDSVYFTRKKIKEIGMEPFNHLRLLAPLQKAEIDKNYKKIYHSAAKAILLSVFPAGGKWYLGRTTDAISTTFNIAMLGSTAALVHSALPKHPVAYGFAALAAGFYVGSIASAPHSLRTNRRMATYKLQQLRYSRLLQLYAPQYVALQSHDFEFNVPDSVDYLLQNQFFTTDAIAKQAYLHNLVLSTVQPATIALSVQKWRQYKTQYAYDTTQIWEQSKAIIKYFVSQRNYPIALRAIAETEQLNTHVSELNFWKFVCNYYQFQYTDCISQVVDNKLAIKDSAGLQNLLQKLQKRKRNPLLAKRLAYVPGLGLYYAGSVKNGLNNQLLLTSFGFAAVWLIKNVHPLAGVPVFAFASRYFIGGVRNAPIYAQKTNLKRALKNQSQVFSYFQLQ